MDSKELKNKSRYISLLLRHHPEKENLILDKNGYVSVSDLIRKLNISLEELDWIVENNDKKRFSYNQDKSMIKANQGHSIEVDLKLRRIVPPNILYHGTSTFNAENIFKSGLMKMSRHHVHLTNDYHTAHVVGLRYAKHQGNLWIIAVDAKEMNEDGFEFFKSENGVFFVDHVPSKYFIEDETKYLNAHTMTYFTRSDLFKKYKK